MYNFKVLLLVAVFPIFAAGRRFDRRIWNEDMSSDVDKRSYRQVCHDIKREERVNVQTLLKTTGNFFPAEVTMVSCIDEDKDATEVSDSSIICKTKEELKKIIEFNADSIPIGIKRVKVNVDCVAYKV